MYFSPYIPIIFIPLGSSWILLDMIRPVFVTSAAPLPVPNGIADLASTGGKKTMGNNGSRKLGGTPLNSQIKYD